MMAVAGRSRAFLRARCLSWCQSALFALRAAHLGVYFRACLATALLALGGGSGGSEVESEKVVNGKQWGKKTQQCVLSLLVFFSPPLPCLQSTIYRWASRDMFVLSALECICQPGE
jgi:hypothetical protein